MDRKTQTPHEVTRLLAAGARVTLQHDVTMRDEDGRRIPCVIENAKGSVLNLNGYTFAGNIVLLDNAAITIEGDGKFTTPFAEARPENALIWAKGKDSCAEIRDGTFVGAYRGTAFCAEQGTIRIKGGCCCVEGENAQDCQNTLMCAAQGRIMVEGGQFLNYNPAPFLAPGTDCAVTCTEDGVAVWVRQINL